MAVFFTFMLTAVHAQTLNMTGPWIPDLGNGSYKNPIIHADYSDPDVVRVGGDYYLTSSSFNCAPGLQILHSRDLVNWKIVGKVFDQQTPFDAFRRTPRQYPTASWLLTEIKPLRSS